MCDQNKFGDCNGLAPEFQALCNIGPVTIPDMDAKNKCYEADVYKKYCQCKPCLNAPDAFYPFKNAVVTIFFQGDTTPEHLGYLIKSECCYYVVSIYTTMVGTLGTPYARIVNVNNTNRSHLYQLSLYVHDVMSGVTVFKFADHSTINNQLPKLDEHPYMSQKIKSRCYASGAPAFVFRSVNNTQAVLSVNVGQNHYNNVPDTPEFIVVDQAISPLPEGTPLVAAYSVKNSCNQQVGQVIGMYTFRGPFDSNVTGFVPQYVIERVVTAAICGPNGQFGAYLRPAITDSGASYWSYVPGYFGIHTTFLTNAQLLTYNSSGLGTCPLDASGALVDAVDLDNGTPFPEFAPSLTDQVLITHINGSPIGPMPPEVTVGAMAHRLVPNEFVCITYRLSSEGFRKPYTANAQLRIPPTPYPHGSYV
jgi:hypothetical protein